MEISSELLSNLEISTSAEAIDGIARDELPVDPVSAARSVEKPHCLWCSRTFTAPTTGGSAQRFCSTEHRKAFWTAARRWTMRAIETGLLSVDCLKRTQTSVYAAIEVVRGSEQEISI
jgi:hypothetical protein